MHYVFVNMCVYYCYAVDECDGCQHIYPVKMMISAHEYCFTVAFSNIMAHNYKDTDGTADSRQRARRRQALSAQGATHPRPEAVTDPLFRDSAFFDPNDLVQVKYEMLRSVQQEGRPVVEAAQAFGLSRPVFYVTQELFQREGLPGLLPRKRGPKRPHKLSDEAMAVLARGDTRGWTDAQRRGIGGASGAALWRRGASAQYPATAASLSAAGGKKTPMIVEAAKLDATQYTVQYELLRSQVIGAGGERNSGRYCCRPDDAALVLPCF